MRRLTLVLAAIVLIHAQPAFAGGGSRGDWELGIFGGQGWLDDYGTSKPHDDLLYGARLGVFITSAWNLEFAASRLPTETGFETPPLPEAEVELDSYRLNLLYNFAAGKKFRPFLSAGLGIEKTDMDGYINGSQDFGWNAGAGFRVFLSPRFALRADGRVVQVNVEEVINESQTNVEATAGISLLFGGGGETEVAAIPPPPPNQSPIVSCAAERPEILPGESVALVATASDPDGDPLSYTWTASAGKVTGTGARVTLALDGATAPSVANVSVRVTDSRGASATSDCSVRLMEPVKPAEAVSCLAGGFPRNLSRLNNVDKACLDDVVQRLKTDPRARVVVIGNADQRETNPAQIADLRASEVQKYLVAAGIESARIRTRSVAASKPLDTGTTTSAQARNRRVEIWFVPEGAKEPE